MSEDSKQRILDRRARFVTAALASFSGCTPSPSTTTVTSDPSAAPKPSASSATASDPTPPAPSGSVALPSDLPALDVPAGVNETVKRAYDRLAESVKEFHHALSLAEATLPRCDVTSPGCRKAFRDLTEHLVAAREHRGEMSPRCPGTSAEAKAFYDRYEEQARYADARMAKLQAKIDAMVGKAGTPSGDAYAKIMAEAEGANPMPCLKYSCKAW